MTDNGANARADALLDQIEKLAREVRSLLSDGVSEPSEMRGRGRFHGGRGFGRRREEERNPAFFDGRNLSPEGLAELHRLFEDGSNPYAAAQALRVSPRAAYLRHQEWLRSREAKPSEDTIIDE